MSCLIVKPSLPPLHDNAGAFIEKIMKTYDPNDLKTHPEVLAPLLEFKGTSVRILDIAELVAQGVSTEDILARHPGITAGDVEFAPIFKFMMTPRKMHVN